MSELQSFLNSKIQILTIDGRIIYGTLQGFDQTINLILSDAVERIFSLDEDMVEQALGLYLVRGDSIMTIGEVDVEKDQQIDWQNLRVDAMLEMKF
jgi:U6 snRNA-associated Sm-like protein LSm8